MKKICFSISLVLLSLNLYAPPNCEVYKSDEMCFKACKEAMRAIRYKQGSYTSQKHFEKSLGMCQTFPYSFMEKAVPFLKRGQFIEWKKLIDKAVELDPENYLGYRGWCRLQFLRDYEGAIADIEKLQSTISYDLGFCQTGDYHLSVVLALCYKHIGEAAKARSIFLDYLNSDEYSEALYDFYHLGVLEYEEGNYEKAIEYLKKQIEANDYMGETYYFMAMAYKKLEQQELYALNLSKAEDYYKGGKTRVDNYTETMDKIYLLDILEEKDAMGSK